MGGSVTVADGLSIAEPERAHIAFIGDSTFFHMGITGLINAVYNGAKFTLVILDNRTTAMTGHQPHPGLGRRATGEEVPPVDLEAVVRGCGAASVAIVSSTPSRSSTGALNISRVNSMTRPISAPLMRPSVNSIAVSIIESVKPLMP